MIYPPFYFFTTRVHIKDENFLTPAFFKSARPPPLVVINYGTIYLKISALIFPAYPVYFISNGFFMALKKASYAMNLNIIRNALLPIPTILFANFIGGSYKNFFWSYCLFNWIFVVLLLTFVSIYIKNKLHS